MIYLGGVTVEVLQSFVRSILHLGHHPALKHVTFRTLAGEFGGYFELLL